MKRRSGIELLRIILLVCLVFYHAIDKEIYLKDPTLYSIKSLSQISVDTFILITGYFSYGKTTFRAYKFYKWMIFVGIAVMILSMAFMIPVWSKKSIVWWASLLPISLLTGDLNWYLISLLVIYIFSPLIAKPFSNLKRWHQTGILSLLFVGTFLAVITRFAELPRLENYIWYSRSVSSTWLFVLFVFGMWLKELKFKKTFLLIVSILGYGLLSTNIALHFTGNDDIIKYSYGCLNITHKSLIVTFMSLSTFCIFNWYVNFDSKILSKTGKWFRLVYPVHFVFLVFLHTGGFLNGIQNDIAKVFAIAITATALSFIASFLFLPLNNLYDKYFEKAENKLKTWYLQKKVKKQSK
ncbi:MAG: acyltransferase [Mycoplasma sp.]|nr:acyltransferase [Mycoplasma sp.]